MASFDITVYGAEKRGKGWRKRRRRMEEAGKKYHVKELLNIIIFGLISSKFVKSKKQTNEQKYQTNKQIEKNLNPQTQNRN